MIVLGEHKKVVGFENMPVILKFVLTRKHKESPTSRPKAKPSHRHKHKCKHKQKQNQEDKI